MREGPPQGTLVANVSWLSLALLASKLTTLVFVFLLARHLGDELFGRFAVALAIPTALEALGDLGIAVVLIRDAPGRPQELRVLAATAFVPKLFLGAVLVVASYGVATQLGLPEEIVVATLFLVIGRALESLTYLARAVFQASERMKYEAAYWLLNGMVRLALLVFALVGDFGVIGIAKALAVASAIVAIASFVFAVRHFLWPVRLRLAEAPRLLAEGAPLSVVWFLDSLVLRAGIVLTSLILGDAAAGLLAAAMRVVEALLSVPAIMAAAILPLASRHLFQQRDTLSWLVTSSVKVAVVIASAATLVLMGGGPFLVLGVFGSDFVEAGQLLQALSIALVPLFVQGLLTSFLLAYRLQGRFIVGQAVGVGLNVTLTLLLVPVFGPAGATAGVVAGASATVIVSAMLVRHVSELGFGQAMRVLPLAAAALSVLLAAPLVGEVVATTAALVLFLGLLRRFRIIDERELTYLQGTAPPLARLSRLLLGASQAR